MNKLIIICIILVLMYIQEYILIYTKNLIRNQIILLDIQMILKYN